MSIYKVIGSAKSILPDAKITISFELTSGEERDQRRSEQSGEIRVIGKWEAVLLGGN